MSCAHHEPRRLKPPDLDPEISSGDLSSQHDKSNTTIYRHCLKILRLRNDPGVSAGVCWSATLRQYNRGLLVAMDISHRRPRAVQAFQKAAIHNCPSNALKQLIGLFAARHLFQHQDYNLSLRESLSLNATRAGQQEQQAGHDLCAKSTETGLDVDHDVGIRWAAALGHVLHRWCIWTPGSTETNYSTANHIHL